MSYDIEYRDVTLVEDLKEVVQFQLEIWGVDSVTSLPQLVAAIHNGGVVFGAYANNRIVGFCYGFAGYSNSENALISHMMAIHVEYRNRQIGEKLKLLQRDWAKKYGYKKIIWTYDPLESRNGYLNLNKLGAYVRTYYSSYYGIMSDEINKGMPSDRFLVEWEVNNVSDLKKEQVEIDSITKLVDWIKEEEIIKPKTYEIFLKEDYYVVAVPTSIHEIKKTNMSIALEWRYALRGALKKAFDHGYIVTDLIKENGNNYVHYYLLKYPKAVVINND